MIFDLIERRRAVFPQQYNDKPIKRETLETLLEAANWAPTHKKTEPWRFKVLQGKPKLELGEFLKKTYLSTTEKPSEFKAQKIAHKFEQSQAVIAICMQRDQAERIPEWEEIAASAMAVQNIWLGCTELGIGCYWSSPGMISHMGEFFDFKSGERCLGFLYMGYFDTPLEAGFREPIANKVEWLN